jgi:two-component system NarL family sensor kinase
MCSASRGLPGCFQFGCAVEAAFQFKTDVDLTARLCQSISITREIPMRLRYKLVLLSSMPVLAALVLMAISMQHQSVLLTRGEKDLIQQVLSRNDEAEVKHYADLATSMIMRFVQQPGDVAEKKRLALAALQGMRFGSNGYFFAYDQNGLPLVDPGAFAVKGVSICDPSDQVGGISANLILGAARNGTGLVRYDWNKPSSGLLAPKLAYAVSIPEWGWVVGTGIYLDDKEATVASAEDRASANIETTRLRFYVIAALGVLAIGIGGLLTNLRAHRVASDRLKRLAHRVVHSQEEERARVSRELHDGVVQVLASSKFLFETAQLQVDSPSSGVPTASRQAMDTGLSRLQSALVEIRRVSHGLRPALLDDLGLGPAMALLAQQVQEGGTFTVQFSRRGDFSRLQDETATAIFRIAQEALQNACAHSHARFIEITLRGKRNEVGLRVQDDGLGFDIKGVMADGSRGIGLRNMQERAESVGGSFNVQSGRRGTLVEAWLPRHSATAAEVLSLGDQVSSGARTNLREA